MKICSWAVGFIVLILHGANQPMLLAQQTQHVTNVQISGMVEVDGVGIRSIAAIGTYTQESNGQLVDELVFTTSDSPSIVAVAATTSPHCPPMPPSAVNLATVAGFGSGSGILHIDRNYVVTDSTGLEVARFDVDAVITALTTNLSEASFNFSGAILASAPSLSDISSYTGYQQLLQQTGPGVIRGSYTQSFTTRLGDVFDVAVNSTYSYAGVGQLPQDEVSQLDISSIEFEPNTGTLSVRGSGFYRVVPEPSAFALILVGLAPASLRRRR